MKEHGLITDKNYEYLNPKNCKYGQFYLLPKIHKKGIPGRPICSSVNHPTANISKFVDEHITTYVPKLNLTLETAKTSSIKSPNWVTCLKGLY